jgi:DNA helicase HerA-like ATPase
LAGGFYLGKTFDPTTEALGEEFRLRPSDLTTHGIVIGMTGSGKTGLSIVLIEEALQAGVPVIVIDPKGDMGNLALAFPGLAPEDFTRWVDADAAAREGQTADQAGAEAADTWRKGLEEWGLHGEDVGRYVASREVRIITPGSLSGIPLNLIESLDPPGAEGALDDEEFHDQVDAVVTAFLGLLGLPSDPVESREYIFLFNLIENAWRRQQGLTIESLIGRVGNPPIDKLGALPLDVVYPPADRNKLMLSLNNLLASPPLAAWRTGEPVDIDTWLRAADGRPRLTIVYTAHLEEEQRVFVTALVLNRLVSWVRQQPGTSDLRCLLYMDEIFGYFPPTANPPTKRPLITLLKQARAYGLGVLLSTQNPVDLDYRGLANMGFWAIGRLQTTQDQARIETGIEAALEDSSFSQDFESLISGVQKRVFLIHDIHRKEPALVHSRFAMSYLRGPLTRNEIEALTSQAAPAPAAPEAGDRAGATGTQAAAAPPAPAAAVPPAVPPPLRSRCLDVNGGNVAKPHLFVKAAVRYKAGRVSTNETQHSIAFRLDPDSGPAEVVAGTPVVVDEQAMSDTAPAGVTYSELPAYVATQGAKVLEKALRDRLDDHFAVELLYDAQAKMLSLPGEPADAFAARVADAPAVTAKRENLQRKLQSKKATLDTRQQEIKARGLEKWASLGTSILSNLGILTGRKRTVTGVGGVLSKQRMESSARSRLERLQDEVADLEQQLADLGDVDPMRFETRVVKPSRNDVAILRYDILWIT